MRSSKERVNKVGASNLIFEIDFICLVDVCIETYGNHLHSKVCYVRSTYFFPIDRYIRKIKNAYACSLQNRMMHDVMNNGLENLKVFRLEYTKR